MKKLAFAAALLAIAGPAWGADYPAKAPAYALPPQAPPPVWDWSGIYIGANGGGAWGDTSWNFPVHQFFAFFPGEVFSTHPKGGLFGGQIGINRQVGPWLFDLPWVFGVEFTGDGANLKETRIGPVPITLTTPSTDAWTTKLSDLETLTVRFGVPVNNWLFYAKAGGATGTIDLHALSGPPMAGASFERSDRVWGATVGAGIEYGLTQNLILGVAWDFVRLSPGAFNGVASNGKTVAVGANSSLDVQSVVGRLSYKFWTPTF
jgi:outer membrane immunogenic protein